MIDTFSFIAGWTGVVLILGAYYFVSADKVSSQSAHYQAVNLVGGLAIAWNSFNQGAWPSVTVNVVWAVIAVVALYAVIKSDRNSSS